MVTLNYDVVRRNIDGDIVSSDPVQDLTSPDGGELDLNQITSSYVLQTALEGLTLSQPLALADLRDNIRIDRILTEDSRRQQEVASRMMDDKSAAAYAQVQNIDLTYINSFVVSLVNGFGLKAYELTDEELRLVLDRVLSAYNGYLVTTYADVRLPDNEFAAIDIDALDIQESLDLIRTGVQNLYSFCDEKPDAIKAYRSWRTGRSLADLMLELETARTVSVDYLYSYVYTNNIVRDRSALVTTYQYQLRNAQTRLDVLNEVRASGSIANYIEDHNISDGIMYALEKEGVPYVLTGSIRDDGPLPEVVGDAYEGQSAMRELLRDATCVICLATMLHTIATGNMTPSFRVLPDGTVRPVYFYAVDADEFVVNKLLDRGSLAATTLVTNVQDFITLVAHGLGLWS